MNQNEAADHAGDDLGTRISTLSDRLRQHEISQSEFEVAFDDLIRTADPGEFADCQPLYAVWF